MAIKKLRIFVVDRCARLCSDVFMSETKHISIRIPEEILSQVDEQAERMRWSRNAALNTCIEFGLQDLQLERGPGKLVDHRSIRKTAENLVKAGIIGPASATGCPECGALGGVHQKGCKR